MHTYWSDVNFAAATVRVSHKPDRSWTPKAYKEREIPIPTKLMKKLKAGKRKRTRLVISSFLRKGAIRSWISSTA